MATQAGDRPETTGQAGFRTTPAEARRLAAALLSQAAAAKDKAAQFMRNLGKDDEARQLLDTEIQESRADTRAWSKRAIIRQSRAEYQLARTDAQAALRLDPSNTQAQTVLNSSKPTASPAP